MRLDTRLEGTRLPSACGLTSAATPATHTRMSGITADSRWEKTGRGGTRGYPQCDPCQLATATGGRVRDGLTAGQTKPSTPCKMESGDIVWCTVCNTSASCEREHLTRRTARFRLSGSTAEPRVCEPRSQQALRSNYQTLTALQSESMSRGSSYCGTGGEQ